MKKYLYRASFSITGGTMYIVAESMKEALDKAEGYSTDSYKEYMEKNPESTPYTPLGIETIQLISEYIIIS